MDEQQLKELLYRYKNGTASEHEKALIESWYLQHHEENLPEYTLEERLFDAQSVWTGLHQEKGKRRLMPAMLRIAAAASVLISLSVYTYYIVAHKRPVKQIAAVRPHDIAPGSNKAILTLANGNQISITDAKKGIISHQAGIQITKNSKGQIVYVINRAGIANIASDNKADYQVYNTLTTPRGGQTTVTLSDGTVAYLDAASSIKFPVIFTGSERRVFITGQVYFDVVHNAAKPFRVSVKGQTIEDIGTSFNINAYDDEPVIKTTLLSGSIRITRGSEMATLTPGQQAITIFNNNGIKVKDVDTEEAIAWKNGYFHFSDNNIQEVMRQLARWYNVDIKYDGQLPSRSFSGEISRNVNASQILDILSFKKIHYKIEDKSIVITP